jgi:hypothetical protein
MDDYSSTVSSSPFYGHEEDSISEGASDYETYYRGDNDLSEAESEGGLFVDQDRSVSPPSVITLSTSEQEGDRSPVGSPYPAEAELELEQGLYLGNDEEEFDLQSELEREFAQSEIDTIGSDSEETVGQELSSSPNPAHFDQHRHPFLFDDLHAESDASDQDDYDFDEDTLFGGVFEDSEEGDFDDGEDDADLLNVSEPILHHHHHHHHHHHLRPHHFHHPRLPAIHPDRLSPIVLGVNPLQHLGPHFNVNFLPPHLHEHLRRASSSPGNPASSQDMPRTDELVDVELGGRESPAAGQNVRRRVSQNRTQHNVIDLTLDDEDVEIVSGSQNARRQQSQRRSNAPRLNRSDSSYMGRQSVIELSSDSEDDVQATRVNSAVPPPVNLRRHHHHHGPHHHHVPHHHHHVVMDGRSPRRMPGTNNARAVDNNRGLLNMVGNVFHRFVGMGNRGRDEPDVVMIRSSPAAILPIPNIGQIHLDYMAHPFNPAPAPGLHKPPHEAPPKAREGFTRDTNDDDVVICPSCDEELAFDPDVEDENGPPLKKARTKKDKAEHHFWGVKECGHVSQSHQPAKIEVAARIC